MPTVTKKMLVQSIAKALQMEPKEVQSIVQHFLGAVLDELSTGNRIELRNFGVFEIMKRKAKIGRNPKKPHIAVPIPAKNVVKFKPGKLMTIKQ